MTQILVVVDGKTHDQRTVDASIKVAKAMSAKITLLYMIHEKTLPDDYRDEHGDSLPDHYCQDRLDRAIEDVTPSIDAAGVPYDGVWGLGDATKFITKTANSRGADIVVVGLRGLHNIAKLRALRSTPRDVIESSKVPVLVVP